MSGRGRLWGCALACVALAGVASGQEGAEPMDPSVERAAPTSTARPDPDAARRFARQAFEALRAGDAASAASLFGAAADALPEESALRYDQGVAHERAGEVEEAVAAYELALSGADDEVERRALFNLGAIDLGRAWQTRQFLDLAPEEIAAVLRERAVAGGGEPPPEEQLAQGVQQARQQAATQGLEFARGSIGRLRDLLRRAPSDADARHNLELAQRLRKRFEEELRQQQEQQQEQPDQDPQGAEPEDPQQEPDQDGAGDDQQQPPPQQDPGDGDAGEPPQDSAGQSSEGEGESASQQQEEQDRAASQSPEQLSKEEAERLLQKLIEAAMQRAKDVRERKEARLRRTPVERDW